MDIPPIVVHQNTQYIDVLWPMGRFSDVQYTFSNKDSFTKCFLNKIANTTNSLLRNRYI